MKKYFILLVMLPMAVKAQKADSFQFEIIKATVHFYATDDSTFKDVKVKTSDCKYPNYDCLNKFCDTNGLKKVDDKIKLWRAEKCDNEQQLWDLEEKILNDLIANKKDYRKKLPEYSVFVKNIERILSGFKNLSGGPNSGPADATGNKGADKGSGNGENNTASTSLLTWVALLAGLGGLLLGVWSLVNKPKKRSKLTDSADRVSSDMEKLETKVATLNTQLLLKADASIFNSVEQRIADIESWIKQVNNKAQDKAAITDTKSAQTQKTSTTPLKKSETFYAKMSDLPNGFSNDILRNEQNGEQVYEICINDHTATYSVSSDVAAQHYALNDVNYILGRACTLNNQPFANCRINTKQNGTLTKTTEGWIFENKALLEFM